LRTHFLLLILALVGLLACGCRSSRTARLGVIQRGGAPSAAGLALPGAEAAWPSRPSPVEDPAAACPPDTWVYVRADNLADWDTDGGADPVAARALSLLAPLCPPRAWDRAKQHLAMDGRTLFNQLLGRSLILAKLNPGSESGVVLIARAEPRTLRRLKAVFGLVSATGFEPVGEYHVYALVEDGKRLLAAIGSQWLVFTDGSNDGVLRELLRGMAGQRPDGGLAQTAGFRALVGRLPADRAGMIFVRNRRGPEHHAAALVRDGSDLVVDYAATDPVVANGSRSVPAAASASERYPHLKHYAGMEFGPLPQGTVAVASLNDLHRCPEDLGLLDIPVLFSSVRERILPGIEPPIVGFLGACPVLMAPGYAPVPAPVAGVAVRLNSPSVAGDLDRLLRTLHLLATLGSFELGKTLFGIDAAKEGDVTFTVADFGSALIRWIKDPVLAALVNLPGPAGLRRIAFGRIGDWYVVCSQESFFRECVRASTDPAARFDHSPVFGQFGVASKPDVLLTGLTDAQALGRLLGQVSLLLEASRRADLANVSAPAPPPVAPFARLDRAMTQAADVFRNVGKHWCQLHTVPTTQPVAKDNPAITDRSAAKRKAGEVATDPDRALTPLKWAADVLKQRHSFSFQLWRADDGTPRGRLRMVRLASPGSAAAAGQ